MRVKQVRAAGGAQIRRLDVAHAGALQVAAIGGRQVEMGTGPAIFKQELFGSFKGIMYGRNHIATDFIAAGTDSGSDGGKQGLGLATERLLHGARQGAGQVDDGAFPAGMPQANGSVAPEPTMDVENVARTVIYMSCLPLEANAQFVTVMATKMPYVGRG